VITAWLSACASNAPTALHKARTASLHRTQQKRTIAPAAGYAYIRPSVRCGVVILPLLLQVLADLVDAVFEQFFGAFA